MRRLIGSVLCIFFMSLGVYADEQVAIDNINFHEYRGRTGQWAIVESQAKLNFLIKKFSVTLKEVQDVNSVMKLGGYIFVPYSDNYIKELEAQGITREKMTTRKSDFIWPLSHVNNISSSFGQRGRRFHTGTDMPATRGTFIIAVMDGRVLSTRYDGGFGKTICMEHRDSFFTRYAHCDVILVKDGDFVKKGQVIGLVGSTGTSTGNHLHFEIRYNDIPLNPLDFLPFKEDLVQLHTIRNWK